jgi:hypothetical protein
LHKRVFLCSHLSFSYVNYKKETEARIAIYLEV